MVHGLKRRASQNLILLDEYNNCYCWFFFFYVCKVSLININFFFVKMYIEFLRTS